MLIKSTYKKYNENNILTSSNNPLSDNIFTPAPPPLDSLNPQKMSASEAYEIVHSEVFFDSNPQLNLATFVTTWLEPTALEIIKETLDTNYIDKLIYPQTIEMEKRCISILANLFNANEKDDPAGTSTIGSTEAALLAGLNYKSNWKKWSKNKNLGTPQIIVGANVQVCWDKFSRYFEVDIIKIPLGQDYRININEVSNKLSDNTICIVGIFGDTFSGQYDDIKSLNDIVDNYNKNHEWKIPIHVDAASGAFVAPFYSKQKHILWDFRLKWVKSINISGHKYGMVHAGLGWILWRNASDIDEDLVFDIDYLGGTQEDFSLNFSKNASNVILQYYYLTRLGQEGFEEVINYLFDIKKDLINKFQNLKVKNLKIFKVINNSPGLPLIALTLTKDAQCNGIDLPNLASKMKEYGWSIPAYPLPKPYGNIIIIRMVLKVGFNHGMAKKLYEDMENTIAYLLDSKCNNRIPLANGSTTIC